MQARGKRPSPPERAQLRHEIAQALRRARGSNTQEQFMQFMARHTGSAPDLGQWGRYENEVVDPPAYVLVAAARTAGMALSEVFNEDIKPLREKVNELASQIQMLAGEVEDLRRARPRHH